LHKRYHNDFSGNDNVNQAIKPEVEGPLFIYIE